jgi:hypothetical protein
LVIGKFSGGGQVFVGVSWSVGAGGLLSLL